MSFGDAEDDEGDGRNGQRKAGDPRHDCHGRNALLDGCGGAARDRRGRCGRQHGSRLGGRLRASDGVGLGNLALKQEPLGFPAPREAGQGHLLPFDGPLVPFRQLGRDLRLLAGVQRGPQARRRWPTGVERP